MAHGKVVGDFGFFWAEFFKNKKSNSNYLSFKVRITSFTTCVHKTASSLSGKRAHHSFTRSWVHLGYIFCRKSKKRGRSSGSWLERTIRKTWHGTNLAPGSMQEDRMETGAFAGNKKIWCSPNNIFITKLGHRKGSLIFGTVVGTTLPTAHTTRTRLKKNLSYTILYAQRSYTMCKYKWRAQQL